MKTHRCRNVCINSIFKLKYGKRKFAIFHVSILNETESDECNTLKNSEWTIGNRSENDDRAMTMAMAAETATAAKSKCIYCWHIEPFFFSHSMSVCVCVFLMCSSALHMMKRIKWRAYPLNASIKMLIAIKSHTYKNIKARMRNFSRCCYVCFFFCSLCSLLRAHAVCVDESLAFLFCKCIFLLMPFHHLVKLYESKVSLAIGKANFTGNTHVTVPYLRAILSRSFACRFCMCNAEYAE